MPKKAIIIGAGPGGLTAAKEFIDRSDIQPILLELDEVVGGIARTVNYKGNRIDIGPHRFFSKSDRVMEWWKKHFPLQNVSLKEDFSQNNCFPEDQEILKNAENVDPEKTDDVLMICNRMTRIYYLRAFFDYPISLGLATVKNLGIIRIFKILTSYAKITVFPIKNEKTLEDFFINRFGEELYATFFRDYTEKVWGVSCKDIPASWGAQRVKGISITEAVKHALKKIFRGRASGVGQKETQTSLIEHFLYPKLGPGQLWEKVAGEVIEAGGEIHFKQKVVGIQLDGQNIISLTTIDPTGKETIWTGDYFFSTMSIKELLQAFKIEVPKQVKNVSDNLAYRDFLSVGLLLDELKVKDPDSSHAKKLIKDNWIYIQESDVKIGRLVIYNNFSPYMLKDPTKVWMGLDYFVDEGDELWNKSDKDMAQFGIDELEKIGLIDASKVEDSMVMRYPKTYPSYIGAFEHFETVKEYINTFENLFCIGRNGQHKYNNQDHSMLTAMVAVDNVLDGILTKENIWEVNTEQEYHEEKKPSA